jgi:hypothetical protein
MTEQPAQYTIPTNGRLHASRLRAWRKIVLGTLQMLAGWYEFVTGEEAPKPGDILRG